MKYKTKAVRKAALRARRSATYEYSNHKWFNQLVARYGSKHAVRMARDAEGVFSFAPSECVSVGGVVVWADTRYNIDWRHTED